MLPFSLSYLVSGTWRILEAQNHFSTHHLRITTHQIPNKKVPLTSGAFLFSSDYSDNNEKIAREA